MSGVRPTSPPPPGARPAGLPPSPAHRLLIEQTRLVRAQAKALELDNAERQRRVKDQP